MEIQGKIIAALPEKSGVSARGEWKSQTYVIETQGQYPKKLAFDVFGADRITQFNLQVGDIATVFFDFDAHEYNGRWFNSVRAFNVEKSGLQTQIIDVVMPQGATQAPQQQNSSAPQQQQLFGGGVQSATPYHPTPQPIANVSNQQAPQQHVQQQQNMFNNGVQNATPYQPTQHPQEADPDNLPF